MWNYEKRLQYPVNIKQTNPKIAQVIMSQYGGPDGELGASMRYISQRYTMPYREVAGILNDIGTEELERTIRQLRSRIKKIAFAERGLSSALPDYVDTGQLSLPLDGGDVP